MWVSSSDFEQLLWIDCNEGIVDYLQDRHGLPLLVLTGKSVLGKENDGRGYLDDSNTH